MRRSLSTGKGERKADCLEVGIGAVKTDVIDNPAENVEYRDVRSVGQLMHHNILLAVSGKISRVYHAGFLDVVDFRIQGKTI